MREIICDTRTTGLYRLSGDCVLEIGRMEMVNGVVTGATFHAYFNLKRDMPSGAEAVHGSSEVFLADKPHFAERAEEQLGFIRDSPPVAHNSGFDFRFLNQELAICDLALVCKSRMVDAGPVSANCGTTISLAP